MRSGWNLAICMVERVGDIANERLAAYLVLFFQELMCICFPISLARNS